jgi:hypothetical protein
MRKNKEDKSSPRMELGFFLRKNKEDYMKKLQAVLLTGLMVFTLSGCGNTGNGKTNTAENSTDSTAQTTVEATVETTVSASETGDAEGEVVWSEDMQQLKDKITEALGDEYWPDMSLSPEMLEGVFGIGSELYDDYLAEMPMMNVKVDTLLIVKAKNDKVEEVENILEDYREGLVNDAMQYPTNLGKIQASRIERIGNYVCFVQLGGSAVDLVEQGDEAVISECLEQNELVLEVIRNNITE